MKLSKKFSVKVPKDIKIIYYKNKNFITLIGPIGKKTLQLQLKIILKNDCIYITKLSNEKNLGVKKKMLKALCGTTTALLRQVILETSIILTKKLKLIGVGYKVFPVNLENKQFLEFKLGFSHSIYYKIPKTLEIRPIKSTFIYIFGNSYSSLTQIAANIRSYKSPEPYKGKGILYENENVKLKEGKKV